MYNKVAAVSKEIKVAYFSKIDFKGNVFNENCAHLLSIYISSSITEIVRNNNYLNENKNNSNTNTQ